MNGKQRAVRRFAGVLVLCAIPFGGFFAFIKGDHLTYTGAILIGLAVALLVAGGYVLIAALMENVPRSDRRE